MKLMSVLALLAASVLAAPAVAQPEGQYDPRDQVTIDPARAYVFYRTDSRGALLLLREPRPDEQRALEVARIATFDRARAEHEQRLAHWERESSECRRLPLADCPARPSEVALEEIPPAPPPREMFAPIWWQPRFTSGDEGNSYFRELEPGTYVVYGNVMMGYGWNGLGVCLCMGSLRFEARPGQITDLGLITFRRLTGANHVGWSMTVSPHEPAMRVPDRLAGLPRVAAEFRAAGKLPNYFSVEIDRHPPMAGVLAYERDRVIDLRASAPDPGER